MRAVSQQVVASERRVRNHRTSGKGRVTPGPSPSSLVLVAVGLAVLAVLASARFLFATVVADGSTPVSQVAIDAAALALAFAVYSGLPSWRALRDTAPKAWASASTTLAALIAGVGAPLLVALNRHSDAPAGTVVAFWTMVFAGLCLAVGVTAFKRVALHVPASALVAAVAGAAVLASWERPSSFSLLTRFVSEQVAMGVASVLWIGALLVLASADSRRDERPTLSLAPVPLGVAAGVLAVVAGPEALATAATPLGLLSSAAFAGLSVGMVWAIGRVPGMAALPLLWVPAAVTSLAVVESAIGVFGPRPILLPDVAFSVLALLGASVALAATTPTAHDARGSKSQHAVLALSVVALAAAAVGMLLPAVRVVVEGMRTSGADFYAAFAFRGFETIGGWLALSSALLVLVALVAYRRGHRPVAPLWGISLASVSSLVAWMALKATPLHTWVSWIPVDVQQDYGTEYASIVFSGLRVPWQLVGIVGAALSALLALGRALAARRAAAPVAEGVGRQREIGGGVGMRRSTHSAVISVAIAITCAGSLLVGGCRRDLVTVQTGEIVLCTEGEVVSDSVEEIEVPSDEVADHSVTTRVITCDLHAKLAALYQSAQDAIDLGDLETAREALAEVVSLDPLYRNASAQLGEIEAGETPTADAGGANGTPSEGGDEDPGDAAPPTGPVMALAVFVPDTLAGYSAQELIVDVFALTRNYVPTGPEGPRSLVIVAEQFKNRAMATEELDRTIRSTYPDAAVSVNIDGRAGYFGVRNELAVVAFVERGILVVLEGGLDAGDAASLKDSLVATAEELLN